jgi:alpha-ketoglutarate-dependent taurine dioxygenase
MNRPVTYTGVVARNLRENERRVPTDETGTPLVIEPLHARDATFLADFLAGHSLEILDEIAAAGAVLLRGFDLTTAADFERTVLSIRGMQGMNQVLMSEEGRTVVDGTRYVLFTNAKYKTGGTVDPPVFHNENHYVPDVPRFISFFCITPSWLGGETGLVNTAKLYSDLPGRLREKLEQRSFAVREYRVADVAARYDLSPGEIRDFCARVGLATTIRDGTEWVVVYKPSVIEHPTTHERALVMNLGGELNRVGLGPRANAAFASDYGGVPWLVHRVHWKHPSAIRAAALAAGLVVRPRTAWPYLGFKLTRMFAKRRRPANRPADGAFRVADLFEANDVEVLARAMRRRYASFTWNRGDVLIVDNLKIAHAGMPGFGPRNLKALICNCVALPCSGESAGLYALKPDDIRECFGAQLSRKPEHAAAQASS